MKLLLVIVMCSVSAMAWSKEPVKRIPAQASKASHECEKDAIEKADRLLRLHHMDNSNATDIPNFYIGDKATVKAPIKVLVGKGKLDVLEVDGGIYKAEYRLRFIYAQIKGTCALMGQEVIELSNPY